MPRSSGRTRKGKGHFRPGIRHAHTLSVNNLEFDLTNILAVGLKLWLVRQQLDSGGRAGGLQSVMAKFPAIFIAPDGFECSLS